MRFTCTVVLTGMLLLAGGCTSYYRVTDPTTGRDYYTTKLKQRSSGSVTLKDARTGNQVSLQNSEVRKIGKKEFKAGKSAAPAGPAPAPAN